MRMAVVALTALCGCSPSPMRADFVIRLSAPLTMAVGTRDPDSAAFVDSTAPETWIYFSDTEEGDNPANPSPFRLTMTGLPNNGRIDDYFQGDLFFRAPGYPECDRFYGKLMIRDDGATPRVDLDARCNDGRSSYAVTGTIGGY